MHIKTAHPSQTCAKIQSNLYSNKKPYKKTPQKRKPPKFLPRSFCALEEKHYFCSANQHTDNLQTL